jgi:DNA-binding transcriptional regulator YdaS (Cro superfamily)
MAGDVETKKAFAKRLGVTPGRVSQFISGGKIHGKAIVGRGVRARIRVSIAQQQLKKSLDVDQSLSRNGKARLDTPRPTAKKDTSGKLPEVIKDETSPDAPDVDDGDGGDPIAERIKQQRLEQIVLANGRAREEAAVRAGRYVLAEAARQETGRVAARLMPTFESSLTEFANALGAKPPGSSRETLRLLRATWRQIRVRQAKAAGEEATGMAALVEDEAEDDQAA